MIGRAVRRGERGVVMLSLLSMILVLTVLAALVLFLSGKETMLSGVRMAADESLYISEGGSYAGRAALMAYTNSYPQGSTSVDPSLGPATTAAWYANGAAGSQNPFGVLDYLITDGQRYTLGATASTTSETLQVNWGSGYPHLKLQPNGSPVNTLGPGTYTATVTLWPNPLADPSCAAGACSVHLTAPNAYEIFYKYQVTSDGQVSPRFRRRVTLSGSFSVQLSLQSFALYALYTDVHTTPSGNPIWFTNNTSFNGPVHTNGTFRFAFFPTFTSKLESVSANAWYNNGGSPIQLATTENVQSGTRIDAPLVPPDPNPQAATAANFTLGAPSVPLPNDPFNQQGVSVGRSPTDVSAVTTAQITGAIPELTGSGSVPDGVYVPVADANSKCRSDSGAPMKGGIYVQGNLNNVMMSVSGNTAVYTLAHTNGTTTTVTVDRGNNQTIVTSNGWLPPPSGGGCPSPGAAPGPSTRTFAGVPKGWQGPGNANATMLFVNGNINNLSGTLQQNEQTTIASSGSITITGNVQYQTPPNPSDPTSNPTNVLGLYASGGDIVIGPSAPNNVIIQAVLMAGNASSGYNSSVYVQNYNGGSPRGNVNLLGGLIEKYYGPFGTFNSQSGQQVTGYGRAFTYDTRMSRGFTPPYFPTTNVYTIGSGSQKIEQLKPAWREAAPP